MPQHTDWFRSWFASPYYSILYQNRDETEAGAFLDKLLAHLRPAPGARMLDIACGEGRHAAYLAGKGHDVTGIDLSTSSIEKALRMERDHLHFMVHDMRMPFRSNYFDYAFNFFTSFGYFTRRRDNALAARSFAGALKPGGTLVVDYLNAAKSKAGLVPEETVERGGIRFHIRRWLKDGFFFKEIALQDQSGARHTYREQVSAFEEQDFLDFFTAAGLTPVSTFGDYTLAPFDAADSPRLILQFQKPAA